MSACIGPAVSLDLRHRLQRLVTSRRVLFDGDLPGFQVHSVVAMVLLHRRCRHRPPFVEHVGRIVLELQRN